MYFTYITIFFVALCLIYLFKHFASTLGFLDIPNGRSIHTTHIPRGAGIGFFLAIATILPLFYFQMLLMHLWTIFAIVCVFLVGVLDDHRDVSPNVKFLVLIVSTIFLSFDKIVISNLGVFCGIEVGLAWFAVPFTIFAIVGFSNALNLIDGLDGLSATLSIVILTTLYVIGYKNHDMFIMLFSGAFISGLIAFLFYNWYPASIFMGDSGSLTLGFVIAILAIKSLAYVSPVSILFITALPVLDTIIVMIRRKRHGRSMFSADRCHMHHILRHFFAENTPRTVVFLGVLQIIYSLTGLQFTKGMEEGYIFALFLLNIVLLYLFLAAMIQRQGREC